MKVRAVALGAVAGLLALPGAASAHDFGKMNAAFMPELPELSIDAEAQAAGTTFAAPIPTTFDTRNMKYLGFSPEPAPTFSKFNSDLAFQGDRAYQGSYDGFRILDISVPMRPAEVVDVDNCASPGTSTVGQGDVTVYKNVMTRSVDAALPANSTCLGKPMAAGTQGLQIFDISDETSPEMVAYIPTQCGSHTATLVPDKANKRVVVYSTPSSGACPGIDVISIPLKDPGSAEFVRFEAAGSPINCHDTGVILGDVMRASCAGGQGFAVWSIGGADGGSIDDPNLLYAKNMKASLGININTGHSAAFSNDGETLIFGHEPSGGTSARCLPTGTPINNATYPVQTDDMKSFFFFRTETGELLGKWTLPRPQTATENCTLHNYNILPNKRRDLLVHGSYQSGIGVLDFSDPANAKELGYADPKPINPTQLVIGGDWSSHYYNGVIYESDITRGLLTWKYTGWELLGTRGLPRLNPQTQEFATG